MVKQIATTRNKGQLDQKYHDVIDIVGMCLPKTDGEAESVPPKNAIRRQIFRSFSTGATYRIISKAGKKRERFDEKDLSEFWLVEEQERRCKYTQDEVNELRVWMTENYYTRNSPMEKGCCCEERFQWWDFPFAFTTAILLWYIYTLV